MKYFCCRLPTTGKTVLQDRWFDAMREKYEADNHT